MSLPKFYTMKRYRVVTFIEVRHIVFAGIVNFNRTVIFQVKLSVSRIEQYFRFLRAGSRNNLHYIPRTQC